MSRETRNIRLVLFAGMASAALNIPHLATAGTVGVHFSNPYPPGEYAVSGIDEANVNSFDATVKRNTGISDSALGQTFVQGLCF